jgi:hypothetical protein
LSSAPITRRTLLLAAAGAAMAPVALRVARERGYDRERRRSYRALVEALLVTGALPGSPADAASAGDRLGALYADALPRRRREIDAVLDALAQARLAQRAPAGRVALLREWAAAGGERRAIAARAIALASAAYGPADRPLPVVI